jgi:hypothetical protein
MKTLTEEVNDLINNTHTANLNTYYITKKFPILFQKITHRTLYLQTECVLTERIYHILNNLYEHQICENPDCNNILKFYSLGKGYRRTCSNKCGVYVNKLVKLEKYGDENYNNTNKMLETKIENESYTQMIKTHKATCLDKYGVEHHWMLDEMQDKKKEIFIKRYGVDNPMKVKEILDKVKSTNLERYGVENVYQSEHVKNIIEEKRLNRTEEENLLKEQRRQESCFKKFGCSHQMQSGLYSTSGYKWKEYQTPNNNILRIQGYEDKLLDELLLEYTEEEIITERRSMPEIWYIGLDNKTHRYFPDMYIPKTNTIYEVKSEYTLNINLETNNLKFQAVKDSGYNFILKV